MEGFFFKRREWYHVTSETLYVAASLKTTAATCVLPVNAVAKVHFLNLLRRVRIPVRKKWQKCTSTARTQVAIQRSGIHACACV